MTLSYIAGYLVSTFVNRGTFLWILMLILPLKFKKRRIPWILSPTLPLPAVSINASIHSHQRSPVRQFRPTIIGVVNSRASLLVLKKNLKVMKIDRFS